LITPRLRAVLDCVAETQCEILADIGTDHAYLPIEAVRKNICENAIACDIVPGPLKMADYNIRSAGLAERIEIRLGDGLQPLSPNEADCIVIAGMGGMRIIDIISVAHDKIKNARLILQPQHDLEDLRRFLHKNLYNILEEKLVREKTKGRSRFYVILVAQSTDGITPYTDAEYFTGRINCSNFPEYLYEKQKKISGYINSVSDEAARKTAEKQLEWLRRCINAHRTMDN